MAQPSSMKQSVLQVLDAVLSFSPPPDSARFRVEWQEPQKGRAAEAIQKFQQQYLETLPENKKVYVESSLPRYRFVADAAEARPRLQEGRLSPRSGTFW